MRSVGGENRVEHRQAREAYGADVTSAADIDRLVQSVENDLGSIDILINSTPA